MRKTFRKIKDDSKKKQLRRKLSIRKKVIGTSERPRLCAVKSNKHISVQVVDDETNKTLFSVQTYGETAAANGNNKEAAKNVGLKLAEELKKHNITKAVFDRNGRKYTGVLSVLADSIREKGIQI